MRVDVLGAFEVCTGDGIVADVPGARLRGLTVALALQPGRVVPKAALVDWIWGERPPADAANALQRLVSRLRKALPDGAVEGLPEGYRLLVEPDDVDAVLFERLARDPRRLDEALALWRGAALQDVGLLDSTAFDAAATRLEGLRLAAIEDRYEAEIEHGRGAGLVAELSDLVTEHPLRERLAAALMRALAQGGRAPEALLVYQRTREGLAEALGIDPSPELSALHVALLKRDAPARTDNLREEMTSYVGKDSDISAVRTAVTVHRLTTLTGPGGTGKTRLATETARGLRDDYRDGVWLVELAAIQPGADVAQATLAALGLRDALLGETAPDAAPADRAVAALRERETLIVLDNCEHVVEQAAMFAYRLLGECRHLRILATSREPLGITGEAIRQVEPLAVPRDRATADEINDSPAVRLLRDRAGAVGRSGDPETLARVCRALDGMPLAIELAAARLRTMTLDQLANRLDDRFRLLTGGSRAALPRHRTLRAVVDWSWELLSDDERTVLRRLSVFAGGATLEAAERVCAPDAFDILTALTEKSLVVADGERYRMLGTIKEYAGRRLAEAWESDSTRRAHLAYFTELAETADPHLRRAEQLDWLARLDGEHDDIAAAMRGALAAGEAAGAMRLAAAAGWYWWLGGHKAEASELFTAAVRIPGSAEGEVPDDIRAIVYGFVVMFFSDGRGDEHSAEEWIHRAYEAGKDVPAGRHPTLSFVPVMERMLSEPGAFASLLEDQDPWVRAQARLQIGKMQIMLGDGGTAADEHFATALAEFRALGERWGTAFALTELANRIATRGRLTEACDLYEQAAAVVTEVGAGEDLVPIRSRQAQLYWVAGDVTAGAAAMAEAQRYAERVAWPNALAELALARAELARWTGDTAQARTHLDVAVTMLGDLATRGNVVAIVQDLLGYLTPDIDQARVHHRAALEAARQAGHAPLIANVLVGLADLALRDGQYERAGQLLTAGDTVRGLPDRSRPDIARIAAQVTEHLGGPWPAPSPGGDWVTLACGT